MGKSALVDVLLCLKKVRYGGCTSLSISQGYRLAPYEMIHSQTSEDTVTISGKKRVLSFIYSIDLMASHRMP